MSQQSAAKPTATGTWDIPAARTTYNIDRWGAGYFDIDDDGHVVVSPRREHGATVDIMDEIGRAHV